MGIEMEKSFSFCKGIIAGIFALIGEKMGILSPAILLFIFLMSLDYISGMLASKKEAIEHPDNKKYGWSSKKSRIGIYKKIGYIMTILVAVSTDYVIFKLLEEMHIHYNRKTTFGLLVTVWFIINELLSILENAGRMGVKLPQFLKAALADIKKNIDEK